MKIVILTLCLMLTLSACSHFCFGVKEENADKAEDKEANSLITLSLSQYEIDRFHKQTSLDYKQIIAHNRAILPPYPLALSSDFDKHWPLIQTDLNYLISTEVKNYINPQADAQKYINLMLSLIDENKEYQAIVLESKKETPYFIGKYIFISRQEIERCENELALLDILVNRLIRNNFINNQIDFSQIRNNISYDLISKLNKEVSEEWEKYASPDLYFPNLEIRIQKALIMNRAGFKEDYDDSEIETSLPSDKSDEESKLLFSSPLQRHKKVFD